MKKNIIITGGLGYIGTELCKIYSGYSWNDNITVIDNRFISERVNQLRSWNINFIHGDILDKDLVKKINRLLESDISGIYAVAPEKRVNFFAKQIASFDFPEAVGPNKSTIFFLIFFDKLFIF